MVRQRRRRNANGTYRAARREPDRWTYRWAPAGQPMIPHRYHQHWMQGATYPEAFDLQWLEDGREQYERTRDETYTRELTRRRQRAAQNMMGPEQHMSYDLWGEDAAMNLNQALSVSDETSIYHGGWSDSSEHSALQSVTNSMMGTNNGGSV